MLKPKVLTNILSQANTGGVEHTLFGISLFLILENGDLSFRDPGLRILLLNQDGALLAYSAFNGNDARVTSAIVSNCWQAYEKHGQNILRDNRLKYIILQNESGKIFITKVANLLLCLCGNETVGLGILKQKAEALCNYLQEPLREIQNN